MLDAVVRSPAHGQAGRARPGVGGDIHRFECNVCGAHNEFPRQSLAREKALCAKCRSTMRMRAVIRALSLELFGRDLAIIDFPERKDLKGLGMSDREEYAERLAWKLGYQNTYFHREPKLDIVQPPPGLAGSLDFLISSEVFEHVVPPVERAFRGARSLLKKTGVFIFSVPYRQKGSTIEHFPALHDWKIEKTGETYRLRNTRRDGRTQTFTRLVFHGGPGTTLEMRVFTLRDLVGLFLKTGFRRPRVLSDSVESRGIVWPGPWSLPMTVRPR